MLTTLGLLFAGIALGSAASWAFFRSARRKAKLCEAYYRERIEGQFKGALTTMTGKPELIVKRACEENRVGYYCSCCGLEFPLAHDVTPKEAVIELLRRFGEHAEREHPQASPDPPAPLKQ